MSTTTAAPGRGLHGAAEDDLLRRAGGVPATAAFPTVDRLLADFDDLHGAHPDLVARRRIGTSRRGEPIPMYTIGRGRHRHLVLGGVHPNEPIGFVTALHLARSLVAGDPFLDGLDATWHVIPCIDPDGARLNEGWFDRPWDRRHYGRRFYRPAPDKQVEWSFPTDYKLAYFDDMMPESVALMRVIDEVRPELYVSLHNGEMGGVYYYLSRPVPDLHRLLHRVPEHLGLPLDIGEPESPYLEQYAPAIFGMGSIADAYDFYESAGVDATTAVGGSSSSEYANRHGTLSLVAELPYWIHPDADDRSPTDETYADLVRRTAAGMRDLHERLDSILSRAEPYLRIPTPFLEASRAFIPYFRTAADADEARAAEPTADRPATVAERFGCEDLVHCFRLRYGGMLLRALEAETVAGTAGPELRRLTEEMAALYDDWSMQPARADAALAVPIERLVGVQYGAILAAASHLAGSTVASMPLEGA